MSANGHAASVQDSVHPGVTREPVRVSLPSSSSAASGVAIPSTPQQDPGRTFNYSATPREQQQSEHRRIGSGSAIHDTASSTSHASAVSGRFHASPLAAQRSSNGNANASISSHNHTSVLGLASPRTQTISLATSNSPATPLSSSSTTPSNLYQPLSLADAIARSQSDITRALDDVLAERNKFCLEAGKLSSENIRIWNLMGRIRKENEALKAQARLLQAASNPTSPGLPPDPAASDTGPGARSVASPLAAATASANALLTGRRKVPVGAIATSGLSNAEQGPQTPPPSASNGGPRLATLGSPGEMLESSQSFDSRKNSLAADQASNLATSSSVPMSMSGIRTDAASSLQPEAPMSPGAASVMQQRAAAKALQRQQRQMSADGIKLDSASEGLQHGQSSVPLPLRPLESDDDYSAVDASSIGGESEEAQERSAFAVPAEVPVRVPAAVSKVSTPTKATFGQTRGSIGSNSSHGGTVLQHGPLSGDSGFDSPSSPRLRRKDLAGMGVTTGSGTSASAGMAHSVSNTSMKSFKSRLEPREATVSPSQSASDGGLSLAQALAEMANTEPPGGSQALQPRLDNRLLKNASVHVQGTNIRLNERGKESVSFFIIVDLSTTIPAPVSIWRIEKSLTDFLALDAKVKHRHGKSAIKKMNVSGAQLPDKTLFKDHAPSKVDMRKVMLEGYLRNLLSISLSDKEELCTFLCTDTVPMPRPRDPKSLFKDGFLTKKGQNLGRWVTRFYTLDGPRLDYFEGRGGALLGSINIRGAQIGRQQKSTQSDTDENSYRHAFLVLEKKTRTTSAGAHPITGAPFGDSPADGTAGTTLSPGQLVRHVLCAESDGERDAWVDVLVRAIAENERAEGRGNSVKPQEPKSQAAPSLSKTDPHKGAVAAVLPASDYLSAPAQQRTKRSGSISRRLTKSRDGPVASQQEPESASVGAQGPSTSTNLDSQQQSVAGTPTNGSSSDGHSMPSARQYRPSISGPMNGVPIPTGYKFGAKDEDSSRKEVASAGTDRRRFWQRFGGNADKPRESRGAVFGVPLADAIAVSSVSEGLALPSVVFRCIEFLEKKNAIMEEGIYRMSGSTADVKALREQFDAEGDVDLLGGETETGVRHDPHAVAGLLKTFLRELPTSVLTRELHMDFMRVNEISDWQQRVRELAQLVSSLPLPNYSLLRTLCRHLIKVISYQDTNKMTMRNVGIVFSPTLAIPAGVFALFLTSFDYCFFTDAKGSTSKDGQDASQDQTNGGAYDSNSHGLSDSSDSKPSTPVTLEGPPPNRTSSLLQPSSSSARKRSNRNSLNYSEEDAQRFMGSLPLGQHRLLATHPEDPNSYDARMDFMGGPASQQPSPLPSVSPSLGDESGDWQALRFGPNAPLNHTATGATSAVATSTA